MRAVPWPPCRGFWHRLMHSHRRKEFVHGVIWTCRGFATVRLYLPHGRTEVVRLRPGEYDDMVVSLEVMNNAHDALQVCRSDGNQFIRV